MLYIFFTDEIRDVSDTMKTLCLLVTFLTIAIYFSDGLICEKVSCPPGSLMCDVKYTYTYSPNKKITEVICFNVHSELNIYFSDIESCHKTCQFQREYFIGKNTTNQMMNRSFYPS